MSIGNHGKANRNIDWQGIVRILVVQVLVLLALAGAVVWYLNWSSDVAWSEFKRANEPPVSSTDHRSQSQSPVQTVKSKAFCARRV